MASGASGDMTCRLPAADPSEGVAAQARDGSINPDNVADQRKKDGCRKLDVGQLYMPQRNAAVCTGASQNAVVSSSSMVSVIEQPAMSSEVT